MTVIEKDVMEAIKSINRKMRDQKEIDWEQRRHEIAKEQLAYYIRGLYEEPEKKAVAAADKLIAELKKKKA